MNNKIVLGIVVGLIVGLVLGVFIGVMFISPSGILPTKTVSNTNNQVQVSGTVNYQFVTSIIFTSASGTNISSSAPIVSGQYSVLLLGGQSYTVQLWNPDKFAIGYGGYEATLALYVPSGVTTFTANF
ncbi:MAG: hypothetical protein ABSA75_05760 [Candidatus Bathyarchaeia archaeon]|jgi:hypothetical protein